MVHIAEEQINAPCGPNGIVCPISMLAWLTYFGFFGGHDKKRHRLPLHPFPRLQQTRHCLASQEIPTNPCCDAEVQESVSGTVGSESQDSFPLAFNEAHTVTNREGTREGAWSDKRFALLSFLSTRKDLLIHLGQGRRYPSMKTGTWRT